MNYRHAFHAGNFADVLKHIVLVLALARMAQKPKPLRVIDTHAGIGRYPLDGPEAGRTDEWRGGIGRLLGPDAAPIPPEIAALIAPYLDAVRRLNADGHLLVYPGSPDLALSLMRGDDRLVAAELHPEDYETLRWTLRGDLRAKAMRIDGWQAIRALLPPKERRGLVLVDPPFEVPGEAERLVAALADGVRRFATGTYLLWLPIKDQGAVARLVAALSGLGLEKMLWVELRTESVATAEGLAASAVVILNPPFGLDEQIATLLPFLAERLATGPGAGWRLEPIQARPRS